jgi:hypothetical protein
MRANAIGCENVPPPHGAVSATGVSPLVVVEARELGGPHGDQQRAWLLAVRVVRRVDDLLGRDEVEQAQQVNGAPDRRVEEHPGPSAEVARQLREVGDPAVRDDQLRPWVRLDEPVEVISDRRQTSPPVDQDRDAPLGRELEDRRQPLVVEQEPLGARVQLDPPRAEIDAAPCLLDWLLRKVEPRERDQPPFRPPRVLECAVVRRAEGRVPVGLVEAEHEAARDAVAVVDALELVVDAAEAVDVVPEVDVRVEDLRVAGDLALELLVVPGDQRPGPFEHVFHCPRV